MIITVLELAATWDAAAVVLDEVAYRLATGPATDLVLLPEAALHGYVSPSGEFDLTRFAEPIDGVTARRCGELARDRAVHLVAPLVLREGDEIYNAMVCFDPRGKVVFVYRKRHPWFPETWATAGRSAPPVVELCGHTLTIGICYDVHFLAQDASPELSRADVLLFPSAWVEQPDTRASHLADLARRFGFYVVNANWAPGVVQIPGQGGSCIIGPDGATLAAAPPRGRIDLEID